MRTKNDNEFYEKINYIIKLVKIIQYLPLTKFNSDIYSFSFPTDGTDIRSFIDTQKLNMKNGLLDDKHSEALKKYLELEKNLRNINFNTKLNELCDILSPIGYLKRGLKFSDGSSVDGFISHYKKKLKNNELSMIDKNSFKTFLDYYDLTNVRLRETVAAISSLGTFPIIDTKKADKKRVRKFSDGADIGSYINGTLKSKLKNGELTDEQMTIAISIYNHTPFKFRMNELKIVCDKLGCLPSVDKPNSNRNNIVKFSDGTDVGSYICTTISKIRAKKLSDDEEKEFLEIINKYRKLTFREKIKEAISLSIDINYVPLYNKRSNNHYKFSDGSLVDAFVSNCKHKYLKGQLDSEKKELFKQLLYLDFSRFDIWKTGYNLLKEYSKGRDNLSSSDYNFLFKTFIPMEQEKYNNVENKDIVDEVLQDKLFELDPNWIDYGKEKSKQKRKSN